MKSVIAVLTLAVLGTANLAAAEDININGSTTVLPIMQKVGEAYMAENPGTALIISGGGSGNGIKALVDGLTNIAMSSREIKASEVEQAKAKNIDPVGTAIAVDALVPVVHPSNPVQNLTLDEMRGIFSGKIKNWKEVGGEDSSIVMVSRDTSSGTYETWESMVMKGERVAPSALLQASNGAVVQAVSKNKRAIGYIGFGYLDPSLKGLHVNDIAATPENALSNTWPIARELYIYTNGAPAGNVKSLIDYLLDQNKGQKLVLETGFIPLAK